MQQVVEGPQSKVFEALVDLTQFSACWPGPFSVSDLQPSGEIKQGETFSFEMNWLGMVSRFVFQLDEVKPPEQIAFSLKQGPFKKWKHRITLSAHSESQTLVKDQVDYLLGYGLFGHLADDLLVRAELNRLLSKRLELFAQLIERA